MPERTLDDLADAGYCIEDWRRWQQGGCATYALALVAAHPRLRIGILGVSDHGGGWKVTHVHAHDDHFAYDSAGRHPLPYRGVHGDADVQLLDQDPDDYGLLEETDGAELAAAADHATRNVILAGRHTRR